MTSKLVLRSSGLPFLAAQIACSSRANAADQLRCCTVFRSDIWTPLLLKIAIVVCFFTKILELCGEGYKTHYYLVTSFSCCVPWLDSENAAMAVTHEIWTPPQWQFTRGMDMNVTSVFDSFRRPSCFAVGEGVIAVSAETKNSLPHVPVIFLLSLVRFLEDDVEARRYGWCGRACVRACLVCFNATQPK